MNDHEPCILCDNGEEALCDARRGRTQLQLMGHGMEDSKSIDRCLVCLRSVPKGRVISRTTRGSLLGGSAHNHLRFGVVRIRTGHEPLCCGGEGEPFLPEEEP